MRDSADGVLLNNRIIFAINDLLVLTLRGFPPMRANTVVMAAGGAGPVVAASFRISRAGRIALEAGPGQANGRRLACAAALPTELTWLRTVRLPPLAGARRERIIAFEARQAFPVPLAEVIWDHRPAPGLEGEAGTLLAGAAREEVLATVAALNVVGFEPGRLEPVGGALYRCFRYNHPGESRPGAIVDFGPRLIQVILVVGRVWTARVADGGAGEVRATERTPAERAHLEIARLLASVGAPSALAWVRLTGSHESLDGIGEALAEILGLPVERLDPLRRVAVAPEQAARVAHLSLSQWAVLVGLAVPTARGERLLDLLPPALRRVSDFRRRRPWLLATQTMLALAAGLVAWDTDHEAHAAAASRDRLAALLPTLAESRQRGVHAQARIDAARDRLAELEDLLRLREGWPGFLADLQVRLERIDDAWIDRLQRIGAPEAGGALRLLLAGRLLDRADPQTKSGEGIRRRARTLLASLAESPFVQAVQSERFATLESGVLQFEFVLAINPRRPR